MACIIRRMPRSFRVVPGDSETKLAHAARPPGFPGMLTIHPQPVAMADDKRVVRLRGPTFCRRHLAWARVIPAAVGG